ncbi:hypothetical protein Tco_0230464, partial [Tanacetum coccineum]
EEELTEQQKKRKAQSCQRACLEVNFKEKINGGSCESKKEKSGKRRKQMARKGMHTSMDKNDSEDSDKVDEQEETVTCTETPINPVPVAMKTPSVAT